MKASQAAAEIAAAIEEHGDLIVYLAGPGPLVRLQAIEVQVMRDGEGDSPYLALHPRQITQPLRDAPEGWSFG